MPAKPTANTGRAGAAPSSSKTPGSLRSFFESFRRSLLAENKAPRTIQTYMEALNLFGDFLGDKGMPTGVDSIRREHVEAFIADLLARGQKPATAANRYRSLQAFFKWAAEEGEVKDSPMRNMKPPHIPEEPPAVLAEEQLRKLLKTCEGKSFENKAE